MPSWPDGGDGVKQLMDLLGDLLNEVDYASRRAKVVRTGERQPIPSLVRSGVYSRDRATCLWCKTADGLVLDHIVPWSAGGSDDPTNLRLLCNRCNTERSNYRYADVTPRLPLTVACVRCDLDDDTDLVPAFCVACKRRERTDQRSIREHARRAAASLPHYTQYGKGPS